jgi:hypothetical protein
MTGAVSSAGNVATAHARQVGYRRVRGQDPDPLALPSRRGRRHPSVLGLSGGGRINGQSIVVDAGAKSVFRYTDEEAAS